VDYDPTIPNLTTVILAMHQSSDSAFYALYSSDDY
jgi:hypothetical protein